MASEATERRWRQRVQAWQRSGLTRAQFAAEHGINPATLSWWRWRLEQQERTDHEQPVALHFVELDAHRAQQPHDDGDNRIEIVIDELRLCLPDAFDADALRRVLDVLEARR